MHHVTIMSHWAWKKAHRKNWLRMSPERAKNAPYSMLHINWACFRGCVLIIIQQQCGGCRFVMHKILHIYIEEKKMYYCSPFERVRKRLRIPAQFLCVCMFDCARLCAAFICTNVWISREQLYSHGHARTRLVIPLARTHSDTLRQRNML